eukprot:CAMPEP_0194027684 /NCGR_PEP_ID=MMETSP0009_2-20130614/1791_1 /TAXON_ID=210454 /ORGANISM="Grammatophora oceanica, Strain CCMP 410" /LENGTH=203 /DNA_ID=CAMNT_0038666833 /DNA_START=82 /DNA_END=693 /DNA_ORIENTATION=-
MMKTALLSLLVATTTTAFTVPQRQQQSTALYAEDHMDRRQVLTQGFGTAAATFGLVLGGMPLPAFADYEPKFEDLKQIYILGVSLDKLATKFSDPDTVESGLEGVKMFNRDPKFYPGYAKNFISKTVKKNADGDARLGYVKQACTIIGSTEGLMRGESGMYGKEATEEGVKRVRKAQSLIAKFLAESGYSDGDVAAYIKDHPY